MTPHYETLTEWQAQQQELFREYVGFWSEKRYPGNPSERIALMKQDPRYQEDPPK